MGNKEAEHNLISIIMPARNEEAFIEKCLISLMEGIYPTSQLEVFVIDGCSTDTTVSVVEQLANLRNWPIKVLTNSLKTTPFALNIGIKASTGKYVVRADAHSIFPPNYISRLAEYMESYKDADNVGGICNMLPSANTFEAQAIPIASTHVFGAGDARWRLGVNKPTFVDTVPFGFFRRTVFEKFGLFDEELVRNQDDEFNHRIIRGGGKILLVPDVSIDYYTRPTLRSHALMYYQYGYFKPLVIKKLGGAVTLRQFVPSFFMLSVFILVTASLVTQDPVIETVMKSLVALYLLASIVSAADGIRKVHGSMRLIPWIYCAFWGMHFSYGFGFFHGILDFIVLKKKSHDVGITR